MLISLFPTPFDHFHFHPTLGLDPALILTLRRMHSEVCHNLTLSNASSTSAQFWGTSGDLLKDATLDSKALILWLKIPL